jgi:hypothetical protein
LDNCCGGGNDRFKELSVANMAGYGRKKGQ